MSHLRLAVVVAMSLSLAACASSGTAAASGSGFDRNRISAAEVASAMERNIHNVYDLVVNVRPMWLRSTGSGFGGNAGSLVVYQDRARLGGVEALRSVTLANVAGVRYLSPSEAAGEFGLDVNYGAIQILSNR